MSNSNSYSDIIERGSYEIPVGYSEYSSKPASPYYRPPAHLFVPGEKMGVNSDICSSDSVVSFGNEQLDVEFFRFLCYQTNLYARNCQYQLEAALGDTESTHTTESKRTSVVKVEELVVHIQRQSENNMFISLILTMTGKWNKHNERTKHKARVKATKTLRKPDISTNILTKTLREIEQVKARFLKRALRVGLTAPSRLVNELAKETFFVEDLRLALPCTIAFDTYIAERTKKRREIGAEFYATDAMLYRYRTKENHALSHVTTRAAIHGFHHKISATERFHEPSETRYSMSINVMLNTDYDLKLNRLQKEQCFYHEVKVCGQRASQQEKITYHKRKCNIAKRKVLTESELESWPMLHLANSLVQNLKIV
ncbi:hypothetical protein C0J52_21049 [Blattella germanica]|nr:hypothetical protein C0J52_21049 [Blattella germanica]